MRSAWLSQWVAFFLAVTCSTSMAKGAVQLKAREIVAHESRLGEGLDQVDREIAKLVGQLTKTQDERRLQLKMVATLENASQMWKKRSWLSERE